VYLLMPRVFYCVPPFYLLFIRQRTEKLLFLIGEGFLDVDVSNSVNEDQNNVPYNSYCYEYLQRETEACDNHHMKLQVIKFSRKSQNSMKKRAQPQFVNRENQRFHVTLKRTIIIYSCDTTLYV